VDAVHHSRFWSRAIGALTVSFGAGQMLGPVAIGKLNDTMDRLTSGLVVSSVLLMLGAGRGLLQRDVSSPDQQGAGNLSWLVNRKSKQLENNELLPRSFLAEPAPAGS